MLKRKRKTINSSGWICLLIFTLLLSNCESPKTSLSDDDQAKLISSTDQFLSNWHVAAAEANYENYFGKMDSISVFIGTDASENWDKTEFASFSKPYFDQGKAWSFSALERNIYTNKEGSFLWFDELLDTWMGLCRGSGVLENKDGNLTIKHYVLSVTVPNDDIQGLIELKKEKDSLFSQSLRNKLLNK